MEFFTNKDGIIRKKLNSGYPSLFIIHYSIKKAPLKCLTFGVLFILCYHYFVKLLYESVVDGLDSIFS